MIQTLKRPGYGYTTPFWIKVWIVWKNNCHVNVLSAITVSIKPSYSRKERIEIQSVRRYDIWTISLDLWWNQLHFRNILQLLHDISLRKRSCDGSSDKSLTSKVNWISSLSWISITCFSNIFFIMPASDNTQKIVEIPIGKYIATKTWQISKR